MKVVFINVIQIFFSLPASSNKVLIHKRTTSTGDENFKAEESKPAEPEVSH